MRAARLWLIAALLCATCVAGAQIEISGLPRTKEHVVYFAEPQTVAAGRVSTVVLRFRVENGFHVNSHTPKSELLIPTTLALTPDAGVRLGAAEYPAGSAFSFAFDPAEKIDVYTGDFSVTAHMTARVGTHSVKGTLHYQACDTASCYPPRSLPVEVVITAK